MILVAITIGILIFTVGAAIIVNPAYFSHFLHKYQNWPTLRVFAVIVRLLVGILLVSAADLSRFPLVIKSIGWISIVAAASLMLMGPQNFQRLMTWALKAENPYMRVGGVVGVALGVFIVYAFYRF